ncbi:hypothetical protein Tco_0590722 [Tanacetum coccineum]|uniref:Uncharacterized protein n=1 Tax=Tanacetum coccineum TaxID=301880 RepID=A0ABQ5C2S2_9ASTR
MEGRTIVCFGKTAKLAHKICRTFKILDKDWSCAYRLRFTLRRLSSVMTPFKCKIEKWPGRRNFACCIGRDKGRTDTSFCRWKPGKEYGIEKLRMHDIAFEVFVSFSFGVPFCFGEERISFVPYRDNEKKGHIACNAKFQ